MKNSTSGSFLDPEANQKYPGYNPEALSLESMCSVISDVRFAKLQTS
jgi:hypothetical protein